MIKIALALGSTLVGAWASEAGFHSNDRGSGQTPISVATGTSVAHQIEAGSRWNSFLSSFRDG